MEMVSTGPGWSAWSAAASDPGTPAFDDLIEAIGLPAFGEKLLGLLHREIGAEHCATFRFDEDEPHMVASVSLDGTDTANRQSILYTKGGYWRQDPIMPEARNRLNSDAPSLIRLDVNGLPGGEFRDLLYRRTNIRERILICGRSQLEKFGLSILRSGDSCSLESRGINRLRRMARGVMSIVAKHHAVLVGMNDLAHALTSLDEIERRIAAAEEPLPRREAEVCARILYGLSGAGIAVDLGISEQTVMTYRKRAYGRLNIGSQRELLLWYMSLWQRSGLTPIAH